MAAKKQQPKLELQGMPNKRQIEFFECTSRHIAYGGARGGGKSWAMRRKFVLLALRYPGIQILLLRRTMPELRENHILPLQAELNGVAKYNADEKSFTFPNNSRIKCGYCDNEADVFQYQGQEYTIIGMEEACHFTDSQRQFLTTCNRSTRTDIKPRMYYTANPGGPGHAWFKRLFIDKEYESGERPEDYVFIPARVYDNTVLMATNPEYVQTLEALPEDLRRAHLYGDFNSYQGMFFKEWREEIHVVTPRSIPYHWKKFRSLDYGMDMTACYWWAVAENGQCYVYREIHEPDLTLVQAAEKINQMTPDDEHIIYTVASPDLWNRSRERGIPNAEIMQYHGLTNLMKANNRRIPGWRIMHEFLRPYVVKEEDGTERTTAKLQVFDCCPMLIKYIPMLQYDTNNPEDAAKHPHDVTHGSESIRYGCMSRQPETAKQAALYFPQGTSEADKDRIRTNLAFEKEYEKMRNQGQIRYGW